MMLRRATLAISLALAVTWSSAEPAHAQTVKDDTLKIPHTRYALDNGLTVILHEDHSQPMVVVNLNYNVGSSDEDQGRTGFAHLFEHLMFMGTSRVPTKKFDEWMEQEGAWNNAWTSQDRTDYYDVGPSHALPLLLWLEADRLSTLGREIDAAKLTTQRDVVRNERRQQIENRPYQKAERLLMPELLWPKGHPYHHPVIGSHEDLEAATVDDCRNFFEKWYVPHNAALVVAGDFDPATIRPTIEQYFGGIPAANKRNPPTPVAVPAKLSGVTKRTVTDDVTLGKVILAWRSPALYKRGDAELDLLSEILSEGKDSRLYKALVYEQKLAQSVSAYQASKQDGSHFEVEALARPGIALEDLQIAIDAEISKVLTDGIEPHELERARNQYETSFVSRMQSVATRASLLNGYQATVGKPDWAAADLRRYLEATADDIRNIAQEVLDPEARVILFIKPEPAESAEQAEPVQQKADTP